MSLRGSLAVFRFEWNRTATLPRLAWLVGLSLFPVLIVILLLTTGAPINTLNNWAMLLFYLIPEVVCLMGLLLWATPIIHSELEGKTWVYLAVRPGGRVSVLLGKYLTAVSWTVLAALLSLAMTLLIARPEGMLRIGWSLALLVFLSTIAYGSLFCTIGVLFHRRAMVVAVAYTFFFEFLVGMIPAVINQFTVQYRLRSLLFIWLQEKEQTGEFAPEWEAFVGTSSAGMHLFVLAVYTAVLLGAAALILLRREYVRAEQD